MKILKRNCSNSFREQFSIAEMYKSRKKSREETRRESRIEKDKHIEERRENRRDGREERRQKQTTTSAEMVNSMLILTLTLRTTT